MVNHENFHQRPTDFNAFFQAMAGINFSMALELAKMDNEVGRFNAERLTFWIKVWWRYLDILER